MARKQRMSAAGESILAGLHDAIAYAQGDTTTGTAYTVRVPAEVDVKAIRERLGVTQAAFAQRYGFALSSVQNWEQGRRQPEGPARAFLLVIEKEPAAVDRALASCLESTPPDDRPAASMGLQRQRTSTGSARKRKKAGVAVARA
jgi:putative transcriptional regulator